MKLLSGSKQFITGALLSLIPFLGFAETVPPKTPEGLTALIWPNSNPYGHGKVELGKKLFFDKRLSADNSIACATCHNPKYGFSDGQKVSKGIGNKEGNRNAPTIINCAYSPDQFWDGRASSLEDQAKGPIQNPVEMGIDLDTLVTKLRAIEEYRRLFAREFGAEEFTIDDVAKAISTYERTILSGNSPYDRYKAGDIHALSEKAKQGMDVFFNKGNCAQCHSGINFTDSKYYNLGVGAGQPNQDLGRFNVTKKDADRGAFKTPTLREIASTGPYMHDGSIATLKEVVDFYQLGGLFNEHLDQRVVPLSLSDEEKENLVEFLQALSGEGWQESELSIPSSNVHYVKRR